MKNPGQNDVTPMNHAAPQDAKNTVAKDTNRYEVFESEVLGQGPLAVIHRGYDFHLKRPVAIKVLRDSAGIAESVWKSAFYCASTSRPNHVGVLNVDQDRGWIIMELMESGLLDLEGSIDAKNIQGVLADGLVALSRIHAEGRWHGAVKPGNLFLDADGTLKVADARGFEEQTAQTLDHHDHRHIAPEVLHPSAFGRPGMASDLYLLATCLVRALIGTKRYDKIAAGGLGGTVDWAQWHASQQTEFPSLKDLDAETPSQVADVLNRMLAKNVSGRYSNAEEALAELRSASPMTSVDGDYPETQGNASSSQSVELDRANVILHVGPNAGVGSQGNTRSNEFDWESTKVRVCDFFKEHKLKIASAICILTAILFVLPTAMPREENIRISVIGAEDLTVEATNSEGAVATLQYGSGDPYLEVPAGHWHINGSNGDEEYKVERTFHTDDTVQLRPDAPLVRELPHTLLVNVAPSSAKVEVLIDEVWHDVTDLMEKYEGDPFAAGVVDLGDSTELTKPARIRVAAAGYEGKTKDVLVEGRQFPVEVILQKERRVSIVVEPRPEETKGLVVFVNGNQLKPTAQNQYETVLPNDTEHVTIYAAATGFRMLDEDRLQRTIEEFPSQQIVRLEPVDMPRLTPRVENGAVRITSDPPGAEIFVDGKRTAWTTPAVINTTAGTHSYRLHLDGYKDKALTREIKPVDDTQQEVIHAKLDFNMNFTFDPTYARN